MAPAPRAFPKTQLIELYVKQGLSTDAVAKVLGCNHATVLNYLKKYEIPRRSRLGNRKAVRIAKETLIDLYQNQKLTQKQIAHKFNHSRYGVQRWMKIYGIKSRNDSESHTRYPKHNFSGDLAEKAYMIGFRLGDLNVMQVKNLVQVRVSSTIPAQIQLFKNLFAGYGHIHIRKFIRGSTGVEIIDAITLLNKSFKQIFPISSSQRRHSPFMDFEKY